MGKFRFTMPDGSVYDAEAGTWEEAQKGVYEQINQDKIDAAKQEYKDAPITSKAHMALSDPLNQIVHGLTAGMFDKGFDAATGAKSAEGTEAGAARMGPTATTAARAGGAMMLPSAVPAAVARVGGGPLMQGMVGAGVAGIEGGIYGGINAATGPVDPMTGKPVTSVPEGILGGGVGGAIAQPISQGLGSKANDLTKWWKGINDAAPKRNITQIPQGVKDPSARDLVDIAAAKATSTGGKRGSAEATQAAQRDAYEKLMTGKYKSKFTKTQLERMDDIVKGDTGTRWAETGGKYLGDKLFATGMGVGAGATSGFIPGMLATGAMLGGGKALTKDAAAATQASVDRLRQLIYKKTPFRGPLSDNRVRTIAQGLGFIGREGVEDYLD